MCCSVKYELGQQVRGYREDDWMNYRDSTGKLSSSVGKEREKRERSW